MFHAKPLNAFPDATTQQATTQQATTRRRVGPGDWLPDGAPALALPAMTLALALFHPGQAILWLAFAAAAAAATCFVAAASLREYWTGDFDSLSNSSVIEYH